MRIFSSVATLVIAIAAAGLFGACNSTERTASKVAPSSIPAAPNKSNPGPKPADSARRVNVKEAQDLIASGQVLVVDVRNQAAFDQGHIPGAKLIPFGEVANRSGELPRNKTIITYCS